MTQMSVSYSNSAPPRNRKSAETVDLLRWTIELADQIESLVGDGVSVAFDQRDLAFPGVLLTPLSIENVAVTGTRWEVVFEVYVVGSPGSPADALDQIGAMLGPLITAYSVDVPVQIGPVTGFNSVEPAWSASFKINTTCEDN